MVVSWLGIGAQRCGTTWFTDLLLQNPEFSLGRSETKELHVLDRCLGDVDHARKAYEKEFAGALGKAGEFTPSYLRCLWAPKLAADLLDPDVVVVLLRDPIDRFHSSMRLNEQIARRPKRRLTKDFRSRMAMDAQWAGMYADQLDAWGRAIDSERMVVLQFEQVLADPLAAVTKVWNRLGLEQVPIHPDEADRNEVRPERSVLKPSIDDDLRALYRPQLGRLESWGIDPSLWVTLAA